jgi:hypothetical protein
MRLQGNANTFPTIKEFERQMHHRETTTVTKARPAERELSYTEMQRQNRDLASEIAENQS